MKKYMPFSYFSNSLILHFANDFMYMNYIVYSLEIVSILFSNSKSSGKKQKYIVK